jgi:hypothetical protein
MWTRWSPEEYLNRHKPRCSIEATVAYYQGADIAKYPRADAPVL